MFLCVPHEVLARHVCGVKVGSDVVYLASFAVNVNVLGYSSYNSTIWIVHHVLEPVANSEVMRSRRDNHIGAIGGEACVFVGEIETIACYKCYLL